MAKRLSKEEIEELRSHSAQEFMDPFPMLTLLTRYGQLPENCPTEFWVDQWKQFRVILSKTKLPPRAPEEREKPTLYCLLELNYHRKLPDSPRPSTEPSCPEHDAVYRACWQMLDNPEVIDWNANLIFDYVSSDLWVILETKLHAMRRIPINRTQPQFLYSATRRTIRCPALPSGTSAVTQRSSEESHLDFIGQALAAREGLLFPGLAWTILQQSLGWRSPPYCSAALSSLLGDVVVTPVPWQERAYEGHAVAMVARDVLKDAATAVVPVGVEDGYTQDMLGPLGFSRITHPTNTTPLQVRRYRVLEPPVPLIDWKSRRSPKKRSRSHSGRGRRFRKERTVGE